MAHLCSEKEALQFPTEELLLLLYESIALKHGNITLMEKRC